MNTDCHVGDTVKVIWKDHCAGPKGWHDTDDLPEVLSVVTFGVVVAVFEDYIVVASSLGWNAASHQVCAEDTIGDTTAIVRSCITEIKCLS